MFSRTLIVSAILLASEVGVVDSFAVVRNPMSVSTSSVTLKMGLFDGVREAFSAPALEKPSIDKERETPIDRWMGWSVVSENEQQQQQVQRSDFIDSMDASNYVIVELPKPMGIVFEENDADHGGIFIQSIKEDGAAFQVGGINEGDQLIAVNTNKVSGLSFDDALGAIVESAGATTKLTLFRGSAKQFYGPTGASQKWVDEFVGVSKSEASVTSEETA